MFIMKVFQVFVYSFSFVFAINIFRKKEEVLTIIPVAFVGGTLFHMIWEAKSRYVFPYFVFFNTYSSLWINYFLEIKIIEYRKTKEEKNEKK